MKPILIAAALNLLLASVSFAQKPITTSPEIVGEIRKLTRSWDKAMLKRDVASLNAILADDYFISGLSKRQYLELIQSSDVKYTSYDRQVLSHRTIGSVQDI